MLRLSGRKDRREVKKLTTFGEYKGKIRKITMSLEDETVKLLLSCEQKIIDQYISGSR